MKKTQIMGILNITPDSFAGDGLYLNPEETLKKTLIRAEQFLNEGADWLDIGGESTRPGASPISATEELQRVIPVIQALRKEFPHALLSVDSTKSHVAHESIQAGASMINDVSGLTNDPRMVEIAKEKNVKVVIMHSHQETTSFVQQKDLANSSENILQQVCDELERLAIYAISQGLPKERIVLDPGIGFGKVFHQNLQLIGHLDVLKNLGYPILMGVSRKSFIGKITGAPACKRLGGSIAANLISVLRGADILRVHDVGETRQAIDILHAILEES